MEPLQYLTDRVLQLSCSARRAFLEEHPNESYKLLAELHALLNKQLSPNEGDPDGA